MKDESMKSPSATVEVSKELPINLGVLSSEEFKASNTHCRACNESLVPGEKVYKLEELGTKSFYCTGEAASLKGLEDCKNEYERHLKETLERPEDTQGGKITVSTTANAKVGKRHYKTGEALYIDAHHFRESIFVHFFSKRIQN